MTGIEGIAVQDGPASAPAARSRDFHKARRHSRWVRFAKLAIPLGALIAVVLIALVAYLDPFRKVEGLTLGPVSVNGTNVTMESPKLTGFKNDKRPYEVTATAATQDVRKPNFVELKDLRARLVTDEKGSVARLQADVGVLDTQKEQMNLRQNVRVRTDAGQEVQLLSAFVDFKAGTVVSQEPVVVNFGNGVIEATGLEVSDNGKVMHFKGRVSTTLNPGEKGSPSASSTTPAPAAPGAQPTSQTP